MTRPISSRAGSPAGAALVDLAPKEVCQRTFCDAYGPRSRASHRAGSRLGHTASIAIALCLLIVAYFAWQFAR